MHPVALTFCRNICTLLARLQTPSIHRKITMFAVVEIAGQQHKVSPSEKIFVPLLPDAVGSTVQFDRVLLLADDKGVKIGSPFVKNAAVAAKVIGQVKDDTVIVFKKKRRKGYRVRRGHRQRYTQVEITSIG